MEFKKKASITVTAAASAAEIVAAARTQPGFEALIAAAAQRGAEAGTSTSGLKVVSTSATFADDGSATVDLVYEADEAAAPAGAGQGAPAPDQPIVFATSAG